MSTPVTVPTAPIAGTFTFAPVPAVRGARVVTVETMDAREESTISLRFRVRSEGDGESLTAEYLSASAWGPNEGGPLSDADLRARGVNVHAPYMAREVAWAWAKDVLDRAALAAMPDPDELLDDAD